MDDDLVDKTCRFIQQQYAVQPNQSWGRLKDLDLRAYWDKHGCNARIAAPAAPAQPADERLPVHCYWGNWNDGVRAPQLLSGHSKAAFISSFWDVTADCHVTGRNSAQEVLLRSLKCTVLAGVGGWGSTTPFGYLMRDKRAQLIQVLGNAVVDAGWQGLAVDWEYPNDQNDWSNLTRFCQDYKRSWPQQTLAVAAASELSAECDWLALGRTVDWLHIMTYDFTGEWSHTANHNSSVSAGIASLKAYERAGVPRAKLMMGSAWYGRQCKAATLGAEASGPWLERTYADIQGSASKLGPGWTQHRNQDGSPWLSNERTGQVLTYEDPTCVRAKLDWVRNNGFGGVMCWEWGQDNSTSDMSRALLL